MTQSEPLFPQPDRGADFPPGAPEIVPPSVPSQVMVRLPQAPPLVTYILIGITVVIFLLQLLTRNVWGADMPAMWGLKVNELIREGQWWRLVSPVVLHSDILHIGFNMYALYILGNQLERFYGHGRFLLLYIVSGFSGVVISFLLTASPSLGASTAVFGLLGAYGMFAWRNQHIFGRQSKRIIMNVVQIAGINFLLGLSPNIDNWGHFGGLLGGLLLSFLGGPEYRMEGNLTEMRLEDEHTPTHFVFAVLVVMVIFSLLAFLGM